VTLRMVSDKELLDHYKVNPESGFQKIVEKFQERIYWQIRRLVKNHEDSADVMQNVFIKVWKALPEFREEAALYTWIYRIAFNESHTFLSKESKKKTVDLDPPFLKMRLK
jgi:RNA polymerase sigma factor (sigma-70 family)